MKLHLITYQSFFALLLAFIPIGVKAQQQADDGGFSIRQLTDSTSLLLLDYNGHHDEWKLDYPTYRFMTADLNDDGVQEAVVGVIKPTRFFDKPEKRLFIYKNHDGHIRPLWMGSKVGRRLIDFKTQGKFILCITESATSNNQTLYDVPVFKLSRFGLDFVEYKAQDLTEQQARQYLE